MVSVSLPSAMSVDEGDGTVEVCATLTEATDATERDFMITLATNNGTALGKYRSYNYYISQVMICTPCYSWV